MPNTLLALAPKMFAAAKEVASEPWGLIDAISKNFDDKGVAINDDIDITIAPVRAASDFVAGVNTVQGSDAVATTTKVRITKSRKVDWHLTGEQQRSLQNSNTNQDWINQLLQQGMRTLRNEAEVDAANAAKLGASRAVGTAGVTPFTGGNLDPLVDLLKMAKDNGAPCSDLQYVANTSVGAALRKLGVVQNHYQAGTDEERRSGVLQRQFGYMPRESAGIALHIKGTGAGYTTSGVALPVGSTIIPVITGTGTFVAGDIVTFAGSSIACVVAENLSGVGNLRINAPGLAVAIPAAPTGITIGNNYTPNLAFERNSIVGIMRPPLIPANPTISQLPISDDKGMNYLLLQIAQYGQLTWELHLAWGFKAINTEFISLSVG